MSKITEIMEDIFNQSLIESKSKSKEKDSDKDDKDEDDEDDADNKKEKQEDDVDEKGESGAKSAKFFTKKVKKETKMAEETEVQEDTSAAASLKPAAKSVADPKAISSSKIAMMQSMMGAMNGMNKSDLTKWFTDTMSQFGPGKTYGVGDNSAKNSATIDTTIGKGPKTKMAMPKLNVKEDVSEMFDGEELSEDFKDKASTLFEAAVAARLEIEIARLNESFSEVEDEYVDELNEAMESFTSGIIENLDMYLENVVKTWLSENEVAIESSLRNELAEDFIGGLKSLFTEHYIDVPETKIDILEELNVKINSLEEKYNEILTENVQLKIGKSKEACNEVFERIASGLVLTQREKFASLAEGIEFNGELDTYEKKLKIIKENYFKTKTVESNIITESFDNEAEVVTNTTMDRYIKAIDRTIKK